MTSIGLVIQARMGSSRLPGKVLRPVGALPLLAHVTGRLAQIKQNHPVIVATSTNPGDDLIAAWCKRAEITSFRGNEEDVLERYVECATLHQFQHIVRLTADNPFTDIEELERLIELHIKSGFDYTHSFGMMPLGVGAEIFTHEALVRSHHDGKALNHREHVNEYIQENPQLFRIGILDVPTHKCAPQLRLTVDTEQDWRRADTLARQAAGRWMGTQEAISLCSSSV